MSETNTSTTNTTTTSTNTTIDNIISSVVNATLNPNATLDPNTTLDPNIFPTLDPNETDLPIGEILDAFDNLNKEYHQTVKFYENVLNKDSIYYTLIVCPIVLSLVVNGLGLYETKQLAKFKIWIHSLSVLLGLMYLSLMAVVLVFRKNMLELFDKMNEVLKKYINKELPQDKIDETLLRFNVVSIICGITGLLSFAQGSYKLYCCLGKRKK